MMLLGGKDDCTPAPPCITNADDLRALGANLTVYPDAAHSFDRSRALRRVETATSARNCQGHYDKFGQLGGVER